MYAWATIERLIEFACHLKNRDSSAEDPVFLGNGLYHFPYSENIHHSPEVVCQYCQTRLGSDLA